MLVLLCVIYAAEYIHRLRYRPGSADRSLNDAMSGYVSSVSGVSLFVYSSVCVCRGRRRNNLICPDDNDHMPVRRPPLPKICDVGDTLNCTSDHPYGVSILEKVNGIICNLLCSGIFDGQNTLISLPYRHHRRCDTPVALCECLHVRRTAGDTVSSIRCRSLPVYAAHYHPGRFLLRYFR